MILCEVDRCNDLLGRDLGRTEGRDPLYKWVLSRNLTHREKKLVGYAPNGESGLMVPNYQYVETTTYCHIPHYCWTFCQLVRYTEAEWRATFGDNIAYPEGGQIYMPTVVLEKGHRPGENDTRYMIAAIKRQRDKTEKQLDEEMKQAEEKRAKDTQNRVFDIVSDACTAFGKVPGSNNGGVSLPSVTPKRKAEVQ